MIEHKPGPDLFIQAAKNKRINVNIPRLLEVDNRLRDAKAKLQDIATEKNRIGKSVPKLSGDEKIGADIIKRALEDPLRQNYSLAPVGPG